MPDRITMQTHPSIVAAILSIAGGFAVAAPPTADNPAGAMLHLAGFVRQVDGLPGVTDVAFERDGSLFAVTRLDHRIRVLGADGKEVRTFGGLGSGDGKLRAPQGVALSPGGDVFVADTGNHRICVFDGAGQFQRTWGSFGNKLGQFNHPVAITADSERVYVADCYNDCVQVFDHQGKWLTNFGSRGVDDGQLIRPCDLDVNQRGDVYVVDSGNNRVQVFDRAGRAIKTWGGWGAALGMFNDPRGVVATDDVIWIADAGNHRVQAFGGDGTTLYDWGAHVIRPHEGNGKIHYPDRVALSPDRKIAVICESFEDRIQWFDVKGDDATGSFATPWWQKGGSSHFGARADVADNLFAITEPDANTVLIYDASRDSPVQISTFGTYGRGLGQFVHPIAIRFDRSGKRLFVADAGTRRLQVLSVKRPTDGEIKNRPDMISAVRSYDFDALSRGWKLADSMQPIQPVDIEWIGDDQLLLLDTVNATIFQVSADMKLIRTIGGFGDAPGQFNHPTDIIVQGGEIFVVDAYNFRVQVFDAESGEFLRCFGSYGVGEGQFVLPFGIAADANGDLLITDIGANCVNRFKPNGEFVSRFGSQGIGAAQFFKPHGIICDGGGRVFVVDYGNHRVQVFDENCKFRSAFGARFYVSPARSNAE